MPRLSIGWKLTLWYGAVLVGSLAAFSVVVYTVFAHNLQAEIDRALDEELTEVAMEVEAAVSAPLRDRQLERYFAGHDFYEIQVARPDGTIVFGSDRIRHAPLPLPLPALDARDSPHVENLSGPDGRPLRVASRIVHGFDGPLVIQAGDSLELLHRELQRLTAILFATLPVVLLIALSGGYFLSRRVLRPVDRLTSAALSLSASSLDRRVDVGNPNDELGRLAVAFNEMIARLQQSFQEMQRFTADAAHELRTPLAVLRSEAEVALRAPRTQAEHERVLTSQLEEIERLARLTDQLLFLCREDGGLHAACGQVARVDTVLADLAEHLQTAALSRGISLVCADVPACGAQIGEERMRRLFLNLLDNALKYTPEGGAVRVSGRREIGTVEILVQDTGIGVPSEHLPRLFQRFYRVDPSRSRSPGSGLGLAICRAIVESHDGSIDLESQLGQGTRVRVTLPHAAGVSPCSPAAPGGHAPA